MINRELTEVKYNKYKKISCDITVNDEQIDVLAEAECETYIFECKVNLHSDEIDIIKKQIEEKVKAVNSDRKISKKKVIPYLVVFSQIQSDHKKKFEDAKVRVLEHFEKEVENWRKLNKNSKDAILRILRS